MIWDKKGIALLVIGILCLRFGVQYTVYGVTGDWLWKNTDETRFVMVNAGTPDSEGNRIAELEILQDTGGGAWVSRGSYNYSDYVANNDITGIQNQTTRFSVTAWVNYTLFDSPSEAQNGLQIQISVTGEFTGVEFTIDDVSLEGTTRYIVSGYYDWSYPVIASYDVNINLFIAGTVTVGNSQDLTEDGTETALGEFQWDSNFRFYGTTPSLGQYFRAPGWRPFSGASKFTVELWFATSYDLPLDLGSSFMFISQYQSWNYNMHVFATSGDNTIGARIGNSTTGSSVTTGVILQQLTLYHFVYAWEDGENSTLYINNTAYEGDNTITGSIQAASDLCLGERDIGEDRPLRGNIYEVTIYNRRLTTSEITQEFNGGEDFIVSTTGLNNSWTFNEVLHGYDDDEGTLHDGLGGLTSREAWEIDLLSVSYSDFLFPFPLDYPSLYIWLIALGALIVTPTYFITKFRKENSFLSKMDLIWAGLFVFIFAWAIFVTGAT